MCLCDLQPFISSLIHDVPPIPTIVCACGQPVILMYASTVFSGGIFNTTNATTTTHTTTTTTHTSTTSYAPHTTHTTHTTRTRHAITDSTNASATNASAGQPRDTIILAGIAFFSFCKRFIRTI